MNLLKTVNLTNYILTLVFVFGCMSLNAQHDHSQQAPAAPADSAKKSIPKEAHAQLGAAHHVINYYSPAVRGRSIWGGLVPYDEVWVTGAHRATSWEFDKPITVEGIIIPADKYAIFTIPGKKKWTVIINKKWDQHLADEYSVSEDVLRIEVTPKKTKNSQERLAYYVQEQKQGKASVMIHWEKILVTLPFTLQE